MNVKVLILGMMAVTMVPRILPFFMFDADKLPKAVQTFLSFVPFAVLGALVFPGGLSGISGNVAVSGACLLTAGLISWFKGGIILPISGAVGLAVMLGVFGWGG